MSVLKFNRHKLFTIEDNRKVMDLNRKIEDHNWENGKKGFCILSNNLAGMFDGFLYLNTPALAAKYPDEIRDEVQELFNKIVIHIVKVGESETQIF